MRVVYIGDARTISGIGMPCAGQVYDWPDDVAASLIEQGKAELAPPARPAPKLASDPKPALRPAGKE
jgi:hypothetical protein